ncbi:MAG: NAD/NADP octopine/nopaline dehydrogenase family protein [Bacteroidales bacterium]|nr:NAD/NADP octopine/nopaline dehydrogenase family protein [Bacteroidales bacterium]
MNVCVIGGGHIGTTLTCYIKHVHPEHKVSLYTRRPDCFSKSIRCNDVEKGISYSIVPDMVSGEARVAAKNADIVFIALPHFAVEKAFQDIAPYVSPSAMVGVLPGGGGCEFFFRKYFDNRQTLFGFQRVPFTAKLKEYGCETNLKSWKPFSVVGTLQNGRVEEVCQRVEACGLKTEKASNYLEIALTPTNPILHTSRMYEIFKDKERDFSFETKQKFYVGWTDEASRTLFAMDEELHRLLDAVEGIETSAIKRLSEHYESPTIQDLTTKINSIPTFQSVFVPMKMFDGKYYADTESRMFTEDFPWGLLVIRSYFDYFCLEAPVMDKVLSWFSDYMGLEWYENGKLTGKDLVHTGVIQNYGIQTKAELLRIYLKS